MRHPSKISKSYLLKLSLPIFLANITIPLVGVVDTGLMGHLANNKFLAATSVATSVITMILWSFGFLRMGTTGLVAQSLGRGDYREVVNIFFRNISVALIIGLLIIFSEKWIIILIVKYFTISPVTLSLVEKYISIRVLSAPAELAFYVLVGLFIGLQKTFISSFFVASFCLINIILSYYFVIYLGLEISGVALGTVLSSYLIVFIFLIFTYFNIKKNFNIIPRYRKILIAKKLIKLFNINFDIFLRTLLLTFSFLWITYLSSKLGENYLAVNTILLQFIMLASFFLDAYAYSTESVAGFALGRRSLKSFMSAVRNSFDLSFFTGIIISIIYLILFKTIIDLLTDIDYLRFISYGFIYWIILIPPIASFAYQFDGIFLGTSQTKDLRNSMIFSVILFILISSYLIEILENHGIWLSLLLFLVLRAVSLNFYFPNIVKKF